MSDPYLNFKEGLDKYQFILIIGKYDQILGPRTLYSSFPLKEEQFIKNLLRDALNTKNKFVILDFSQFYSQICKIEVEDPSARGGKQLYSLIILRDVAYPLIPIIHFRRIEVEFPKLGNKQILSDDKKSFEKFFSEINEIYMKKDEVLPLESFTMQIRSGINTIQGFCELILEGKKQGNLSEQTVVNYTEMMLESCKEITKAIDEMLSTNSIK